MSVVLPGSLNQISLAYAIMLCFFVALLVARPYKQFSDDVVALASCFALCMFLFLTLILKVQALTEAVEGSLKGQLAKDFAFTPETNVILMIGSTLGAIIVGSFTAAVELTGTAIAQAKERRKQEAM